VPNVGIKSEASNAREALAQTAAMTREVNVVVTSLAEQQQLIKGGRPRALAILAPGSFNTKGVGEIPSAFTAYPELS